METEDEELQVLQKSLSNSFKNISKLCKDIEEECEKQCEELKNNDKLNVNVIQKAGIGLIDISKTLKGNIAVLIDSLARGLDDVNYNRSTKLFEKIYVKLLDFRTSVVSLEPDIGYAFTRLCDKETMVINQDIMQTSNSRSSTSDLGQSRSFENSKVQSVVNDYSSNSFIKISEEKNPINSKSNKPEYSKEKDITKKAFNLSLRKVDRDEQDTDDSWKDTLKRFSPIDTVQIKQSPKSESHDTDPTDMDFETGAMPDDIFEDGCSTPENAENIKREIEFKMEKSIDIKEESNMGSSKEPLQPISINIGTSQSTENNEESTALTTHVEFQKPQRSTGNNDFDNKSNAADAVSRDTGKLQSEVVTKCQDIEDKNSEAIDNETTIQDKNSCEGSDPTEIITERSGNEENQNIADNTDESASLDNENNRDNGINDLSDENSAVTQMIPLLGSDNLAKDGEIENPFSVETVKLDSDEEIDESQPSEISGRNTDSLNGHNYPSSSDIEDTLKDESNKVKATVEEEMKDLSKEVEEIAENGVGIPENTSKTLNVHSKVESHKNEMSSPTSSDEESKNSSDMVRFSYILSEHNYSSAASHSTNNSSSDEEEEIAKTNCTSRYTDEYGNKECSDDVDSDETDINREINKINISEPELVKSVPEIDLDIQDEVSDFRDGALSQQSKKSYEFDISDYSTGIDDLLDGAEKQPIDSTNESRDITQKNNEDEEKSEDIVEALANLLAEGIDERKCEDVSHNEDSKNITAEAGGSNEKEPMPASTHSDIESTESLLDVTMEEILSDFQPEKRENSDSQETIILDDVEPKFEFIKLEDQEIEESKSVDLQHNNIGDEILELLKDVPDHCLENTVVDNESDETKAAELVLKMMEEDSSDTTSSESDESDDDLHLLSDSADEVNDEKEETKLSNQQLSQALKQHNIVDCYVEIEMLQLSKNDIRKYARKLEDNVDWLCNLSTLNKKKSDANLPFEKSKRFGKLRRKKSGTSEYSSSSDSDIEVCGYRSGTPDLPQQISEKLDNFLENEIMNELKRSSDTSSDDTYSETDDSSKRNHKNASGTDVDAEDDSDSKGDLDKNTDKKKLSKEEMLKKAWKRDPLLRGKLSESDNSACSSSSKHKKKRSKKHNTDYTVASDDLDSDSDAIDIRERNKSKLKEKLISPISGNIPSSSSTDTDSDIEFVSQKDGENLGSSPLQKGRRNIRALLPEVFLAESTQKANKEEIERIERLKDRHKIIENLSQSFSNSQEMDVAPLVLDIDKKTGEPLIEVHQKMTRRLKEHQRAGVQFMWDSCYESVEQIKKNKGSGCILAHCMGLGKTFQVLALVHTLFTYEETNTKHVLVVCPLSTVNNWKREVRFAYKGIPEEKTFSIFTIGSRKESQEKYEIVASWRNRKKALLVLGYEAFGTLTDEIKLEKLDSSLKERILEALVDPGPDLVICDEGHLLRNKKALKSMALNRIKSKRRIVLTGTPLQNNLLEYYCMVQFVKPNLLGNNKEFRINFENPITNGQYEDSTEEDIKLMMKRTHVLHRLLSKTVQRIEDTELEKYLPKMQDHAVFIQLSPIQVHLYNQYTEIVKERKSSTKRSAFLTDFSIFQYICTHPHLLAIMEKLKPKRLKERDVITNEEDQPIYNLGRWWKESMPSNAAEKIEYGNKLVVLKSIIEECEEIGDKVLVFSQSLGELDLIEHFLKTVGTRNCHSWQKKLDYSRMDGTVPTENRISICDTFNDTLNTTMRLLLMSTKVGGLGLNLTAANRVVIMTVNWNPSYDTQSVFRAYRFGQTKEVYVYRLISVDTMEEKVYQRTVTKLAIAHRVVDKHQITRHYQRMHLRELYSCRPNADFERPTPIVPDDKTLAKIILRLPCIFKYHEHKALLANRPEDNLSEQELTLAWEAWRNKENAAHEGTQGAHPPNISVPPLAPFSINTDSRQLPSSNTPTFSMAYNINRLNYPKLAATYPTDENLWKNHIPNPNVSTTSSNLQNVGKRKLNEYSHTSNIGANRASGMNQVINNVTNTANSRGHHNQDVNLSPIIPVAKKITLASKETSSSASSDAVGGDKPRDKHLNLNSVAPGKNQIVTKKQIVRMIPVPKLTSDTTNNQVKIRENPFAKKIISRRTNNDATNGAEIFGNELKKLLSDSERWIKRLPHIGSSPINKKMAKENCFPSRDNKNIPTKRTIDVIDVDELPKSSKKSRIGKSRIDDRAFTSINSTDVGSSSESGSVQTRQVINNLKLSGVTVKALSNDVITLD